MPKSYFLTIWEGDGHVALHRFGGCMCICDERCVHRQSLDGCIKGGSKRSVGERRSERNTY